MKITSIALAQPSHLDSHFCLWTRKYNEKVCCYINKGRNRSRLIVRERVELLIELFGRCERTNIGRKYKSHNRCLLSYSSYRVARNFRGLKILQFSRITNLENFILENFTLNFVFNHKHVLRIRSVWCVCYWSVASFPGLLRLWSLLVYKNGGRRPGEFHHVIRGTADVMDSGRNSLFTFIVTVTEKLENRNKFQRRAKSYL